MNALSCQTVSFLREWIDEGFSACWGCRVVEKECRIHGRGGKLTDWLWLKLRFKNGMEF